MLSRNVPAFILVDFQGFVGAASDYVANRLLRRAFLDQA